MENKFSIKGFIVTLFQGLVMGITEVIPGVSGSTLAIIMGIYDDFIGIISAGFSFLREIVKKPLKRITYQDGFSSLNLKFAIPLVLGAILAFGGFSNIISVLLESYRPFIFAFMFGLVLFSISIPYGEMERRSWREGLVALFVFVLIFYLLGFGGAQETIDPSPIRIVLGGIAASSAMILPGVSGSFVLLLFGMYEYFIDIVSGFTHGDFGVGSLMSIGLLIIGLVTGLLITSKALKYAFKNYKSSVLAILIGLMAASLRVINPLGELSNPDVKEFAWVALLVFLGAASVWLLAMISKGELTKLVSNSRD